MSVNLATIKEIKHYLTKELGSIYNENEVTYLFRIIIKTVFDTPGLHMIMTGHQALNDNQVSRIIEICNEMKSGKPYQYVLGKTEFYNCIINVGPAVLIPRPETEELVDLIIRENKGYHGSIIDLGTGSGCIAIALAANIAGAEVTGIDLSDDALDVARCNADLNSVRVIFEKKDILNYSGEKKAGIFVSNPPYVRNSEKKQMQRNVLDFEPHDALFVEDTDPLVYYRAILEISRTNLETGGKIYFEINEAMGKEIFNLFSFYGFREISIIKDLNERDRIAKGVKHE